MTLRNKPTFSQTKESAEKSAAWHLIDAKDIPLGRLASRVALLMRGKHKPTFTPHVNCGDHVIVVNADKVMLKGKKWDQKMYYSHSGYVGGIKEKSARHMKEEAPERLIEKAVKGMIPRGALGHQIFKKLKVYAGEEHPHSAQNPEPHPITLKKQK